MVFAYTFKGDIETTDSQISDIIDAYYYPYYHITVKSTVGNYSLKYEWSLSNGNNFDTDIIGSQTTNITIDDIYYDTNITKAQYLRVTVTNNSNTTDSVIIQVKLLQVATKTEIDGGITIDNVQINNGSFNLKDSVGDAIGNVVTNHNSLAVYNTAYNEYVVTLTLDSSNAIELPVPSVDQRILINTLSITNLSPYGTRYIKIYDTADIDTATPDIIIPVFKESTREVVLAQPLLSYDKLYVRGSKQLNTDDSPDTDDIILTVYYSNYTSSGNTGSNTGSA